MSSVSIHTLGCKLNFAESGSLSEEFSNRSYEVIPFGMASDVTVINTCSVTEEADRKCRQLIRRAIREHPDTFVIVTGCYAQLRPDTLARIPGVDVVLGAGEKFQLFDLVESFSKREETQVSVSCIDDVESFGPAYSSSDRTRAFLKVQDGCDYSCSFCTIPRARGKSRSALISDLVLQARNIAERGYREVVLSGVNIGLFGHDSSERLIDLLVALDGVEEIDRFRISSIEPNLLTDEIIDFVAGSKRFVPHFHMPLQSGDNEILGQMRRRYRRERYADRVEKIKSLMPDACIGVDVIVGFPGESDAHFMSSFEFISGLPVSYLHVFTYSERPDTAAVDLLPVSKSVRKRRNAVLRALSADKRAVFYREQLGSVRGVLWEEPRIDEPRIDGQPSGNRVMTGFTDNYVKVEKGFDPGLVNRIEKLRLGELTARGTVTAESTEFVSLLH